MKPPPKYDEGKDCHKNYYICIKRNDEMACTIQSKKEMTLFDQSVYLICLIYYSLIRFSSSGMHLPDLWGTW